MKHNSQAYDIPSKFLKLANTVVSEWFAEFFRGHINEGVFSDSLKIACIALVPESRNPQSSSDYRPISILTTLSRVFETLLSKSLL